MIAINIFKSSVIPFNLDNFLKEAEQYIGNLRQNNHPFSFAEPGTPLPVEISSADFEEVDSEENQKTMFSLTPAKLVQTQAMKLAKGKSNVVDIQAGGKDTSTRNPQIEQTVTQILNNQEPIKTKQIVPRMVDLLGGKQDPSTQNRQIGTPVTQKATNQVGSLANERQMRKRTSETVRDNLEGGLTKMKNCIQENFNHLATMENELESAHTENTKLREMVSGLQGKIVELEAEKLDLLNNKEKKMCHECGCVVNTVVFCSTECHENNIK